MSSTVLLTNAVAGMTLGEALQDEGGNVLLPSGGVLTVAMLHALARRGVTRITISDATDAAAASEAPSNATIAARIDHIFRRSDSTTQAELKAAIRAFRLSEKS